METMQQDEVQATPEEQAQLEQAFSAALEVIHATGKAGDNIVSMVMDAQKVEQGIGQAVATVLITVEKQMQLTDDVKLALAEEITNELATLAVEAGALAEDELNDQMTDAIASHAMSAYLSMKEQLGELDKDELAANVQEAQGLMGQQQKPAAPAQGGGLLQRMRG